MRGMGRVFRAAMMRLLVLAMLVAPLAHALGSPIAASPFGRCAASGAGDSQSRVGLDGDRQAVGVSSPIGTAVDWRAVAAQPAPDKAGALQCSTMPASQLETAGHAEPSVPRSAIPVPTLLLPDSVGMGPDRPPPRTSV